MQTKNNKLLLIGPKLNPITGNSYAFSAVVKFYNSANVLYNGWAGQGTFGKISSFVNFFIKLLKVLGQNKNIELVYFSGSMSVLGHCKDLILIVIAKVIFKKKIVGHFHSAYLGTLVTQDLNYLLRTISIKVLKKVDAFVGLLPEMGTIYLPFLNDKNYYEYVLNFYDPYLDEAKPPGNDRSPNIIIYFSNLMATKGIIELLEAFDDVCGKNELIELHIAGNIMSDTEMSGIELKEIVDKFIKKNSRIKYFGPITDKIEKSKFLSKGLIFVLPTYYKLEGVPISIIEAMRMGNIILTTDFKFLPYLVKESSGLCVAPQSSIAVKNGILQILALSNKNKTQIQEFNSNYAKSYNSLEQHLLKINAVFGKVLESRNEIRI
jgi:glycosyltransferase involved in cell wall biosynthesis